MTESEFPLDGHPFGLCLTHDIDRPYKRNQALYYALTERDPRHLRALHPDKHPWWQFERIMSIEAGLGVRSAFYVLREPHLLRERPTDQWRSPRHWIEHLGRYDPKDPDIAELLRELDRNGWEIGVHASYGSYRHPDRISREKSALETLLGHDVHGMRHHRLDIDPPETWQHHQTLGFAYDTSLGSATEIGFDHGYDPIRPFDDEFVVFPLTIMDAALFSVADDADEAWAHCERLLAEARENNAVMTVLWHPRNFNDRDYPGQTRVYRRLIERALELDAWVGAPAELYDRLTESESGASSAIPDPSWE